MFALVVSPYDIFGLKSLCTVEEFGNQNFKL